MKKMFLIVVPYILFLQLFSFSQNVGIGTTIPAEKLDVNGNINLNGNLKVNNTAGQPNQVLTTDNAGNTLWSSIGGYKKVVHFNANSTWDVPAGTTKIIFEAWGGGGGGASGGGGAGGNYLRTNELTVTPGETITITVGVGGLGATGMALSGTDGGNTTVTGSFGTFVTSGGLAATTERGGRGLTNVSNGGFNFLRYPGQSGMSNTVTYAQRTSTQFVEITQYGAGGSVAPWYNNNAVVVGVRVVDASTLSQIKIIRATNSGAVGAGGAGGGSFDVTNWGNTGGNGMVIIYY